MTTRLEELIVRHTHRIPVPAGPPGDGATVARQFDAALMSAGFKLSGDVLAKLSLLAEQTVRDVAVRTLATVRGMAGDHVRHNTYFRDFPHNVPGSLDFWKGLLRDTLHDPAAAPAAIAALERGSLNLLALTGYGEYRHTYEEMLDAHDELIAAAGDRVTVLHFGRGVAEEGAALYLRLAGAVTPLGGDDLAALRTLAGHYASGPHPERIPVRENRAVINRVRLSIGADLLVDTVTDVLRLACALSDGDVTLQEPTRFVSLPRPVRRSLLAALDRVAAGRGRLGDVAARREPWKRLGERLHPHEYPQWPHAGEVFAVARGERKAPSAAARIEARLARGDVAGAANAARDAPGLLFRSMDRLLRLDPSWLSYTSLTTVGGEHSGDITSAPEGASEFINLSLRKIRSRFVIPQVNIYSGEGFEQVEESFFGFMLRDAEQRGRPFEPRTVRMKSDLRGPGRVALPLVFMRGDDGGWVAKWLHLHLKGSPRFNRVEGNRVTTSQLVRGIVERDYLTIGYLADLLPADKTSLWDGRAPAEPVTYIGLERPDGLHGNSQVFTLENLGDLIPA